MKVGEAADLAPDHPEPAVGLVLLMAALGTADHDFYGSLVRQLGEACAQDGAVDESALNFMLSVVKGIKPRDQVEAMLAAQMAAVHMATLACARRLARPTPRRTAPSARSTGCRGPTSPRWTRLRVTAPATSTT